MLASGAEGAVEFRGTERFELLRRLGEGGMGIVYEALDRERNTRVALKTMHRLDALAIYRFKQEFRALSDVSHPNLVSLHELHSAAETLFFTMELVAGTDFLQFVRAGPIGASLDAATDQDRDATRAEAASAPTLVPSRAPQFDEERLRSALRQLALGVCALHAAGKLHRDLKPSNVLVTREGRVVVLDFGLVTDLDAGQAKTIDHGIAGTAEYMSPEQAAGTELSEASDWYSVGAMLYEALAGRLPFFGPRLRVLMEKQERDPKPPSELSDGVPADLEVLCMELLGRRPEVRPKGRELLQRLGAPVTRIREAAPLSSTGSFNAATSTAPFIGREAHLAALEASFERARRGSAATVFVHGSSGMGKSLLVRRFLDAVSHGHPDAVVLGGRCYERESVPYKALDSVVDALSRYLMRVPRGDVGALLPRDILTLARVFPVLRRIEAVLSAPKPAFEAPDPQELRRRAFGALRELLARVADRHPLVVSIDDLQWGDGDSAALLSELMRPPDPPAMLLIGSYRTEDLETSLALRSLLGSVHDATTIEVGELDPAASEELALVLLGTRDSTARARAADIASESAGSPFLVDELVRYVQSGVGLRRSSAGRRIRLEEVLSARLSQLSDPAVRLLEIVAVAGTPILRSVASRAAELDGEEQRTAVAVLRAGHLVRTVRGADAETIETYHNRIRETVVAGLSAADLSARHARIAAALEATPHADPEVLSVHFLAAGDRARASEYAALGADKASEALAFDRSAVLYARALDLRPEDTEQRNKLRRKLGDALANAGQGAKAAKAYLAAASSAKGADALELQRRAAEEFMRSGHVDEGVEAIRGVLAAVNMKLATTTWRALLSIVLRQLYLALRGLGFKQRDASQVSAEAMTRIDICWSVNAGLAVVDNVRAIDFQKRQVILALEAGEPYRVARALASECAASALSGGHTARRTARLQVECTRIAATVPNLHAKGFALLVTGIAAFLEGRWRSALKSCEAAEELFRDRCTGVWWEIGNAQIFSLWALTQIGELREFSRRLPPRVAEAQERGDLYLHTNLRIGRMNVYWLCRDEPERATREVEEAMAKWSNRQVHLQHYYALLARTQTMLYEGRGEEALAAIDAAYPAFARAMIFRIQSARIEAMHLRARCALSAATRAKERDALLRRAKRDARRIAAERMGWGEPFALIVQAAAAHLRGGRPRAVALLRDAVEKFARHDAHLSAAAARIRLGAMLGGDEGAAIEAAGRAYMTEQLVVDPSKMTEMLAPGLG